VDADSDVDGDADADVQPAEGCLERCLAKAVSCMAPEDIAAEVCLGLCSLGVTEEQARCLEEEDCDTLTAALFSGGTVCGIGEPSAVCDDGRCDPGETPASCPEDCTTSGTCGDGTCDPDETLSTCPFDCEDERGGDYGEGCDCGNPTIECEGTENGCRWSLNPESDPLRCLVNDGERSTGFCTRACDPDADDCPSGWSCVEHWAYYDEARSMDPFYRCE
jgi:hypothetical protein